MKKKFFAIFFSLCLCFSLTMTAAAANISTPIDMSEQIVVPKNATLEIIDGKEVYSNFTDSNGNYYDYYCPENGYYLRWVESDDVALPAVTTYTQIGDELEFKFGNDGLVGNTRFTINYTGGYYIVDSYLYNHFYDEEIDTIVSYDFTVKLKQQKVLFNKTVATLNTTTGTREAQFYNCTSGETYFFDFDMVEHLPQDTATIQYYVKGSVVIYGATEL